MLKSILGTSIFIEVFEGAIITLEIWFLYSQIYRLINILKDKLKILLRNSFLGVISEISDRDNPLFLNGSLIVPRLMSIFKIWEKRITQYLIVSRSYVSLKEMKMNFMDFPSRVVSIIIITAIVSNIVISLAIKQKIDLFGWVMRGGFLFVGFSSLYAQVDWVALKDSSIFLKLISRQKCVGSAEK